IQCEWPDRALDGAGGFCQLVRVVGRPAWKFLRRGPQLQRRNVSNRVPSEVVMMRRVWILFAILAVSVFTYSSAEAGLGHQLRSLFGRGTIRTHLPKEKASVPLLTNPGVAHV